MKDLESKIKESNTEKNAHRSRCTECPVYNKCMGVWLNYFTGKGFNE